MNESLINFDNVLAKAQVLTLVRELTGWQYVTIKRFRRLRSGQQNRYYWGVVIPYVAAGMIEAFGESLDKDAVHVFLRQKFLARDVVNRSTGEIVGVTSPSTTSLTTEEFTRYIEQVKVFAAEFLHVSVPDADAFMAEKGLATDPQK